LCFRPRAGESKVVADRVTPEQEEGHYSEVGNDDDFSGVRSCDWGTMDWDLCGVGKWCLCDL